MLTPQELKAIRDRAADSGIIPSLLAHIEELEVKLNDADIQIYSHKL